MFCAAKLLMLYQLLMVPRSEARWGNQIFRVEGPGGGSGQWRRDPVAERIKGSCGSQESTFKIWKVILKGLSK